MILRLQYMYIAGRRIGFKRVFIDDLFLVHFTCVTMMILDAFLFYSIYPEPYFRFGRIFRAIKAVLESREVLRTTRAVLYCLPQIIDLAILLMLLSFIYAVFGYRFLDHNTPGLNRESDFTNLFKGTTSIYYLATHTNHPTVLLPYIDYNMINVLYFYPFVVFTVLIVIPLPVTIIFEAFKRNRSKILLADRMREKEGLLMAFM